MNIAIYSRKSRFTGKGDSIENQIQLCKDHATDYLRLEKPNFLIYEDEGFSGKNTHRPNFSRLINDIKNKKIDTLICYRLDRISRNVGDFSSTLEILEKNNVSFISIREQFDTSTPMGRAMIYIASVFSQLERETIAERIKDNMLELAKNGRWSGGTTPLGYQSEPIAYIDAHMTERKMVTLIQVSDELELVKLIYAKYIELKSLSKVETWTMKHGHKTKKGGLFSKASIRFILSNPVYVKANKKILSYLENLGMTVCGNPDETHGMLTYNKTKGDTTEDGRATKTVRETDEWIAAVSCHEGIVEADAWLEVQSILAFNKDTMFPNLGQTHNALLTSILKCPKCNEIMRINHGHISKKTNEITYYYSCSLKKRSKGSLCDSNNIKVSDLDISLKSYVKEIGINKKVILDDFIKNNSKEKNNINFKQKTLELTRIIQQKEKQIDNLINKLSMVDEDLVELLLKKTKDLKSEIDAHRKELSIIEKEEFDINNFYIELSYNHALLDQCANIDTYDFDMQKQILNRLFSKITVENDGTVIIELNINLSKKKVHLL